MINCQNLQYLIDIARKDTTDAPKTFGKLHKLLGKSRFDRHFIKYEILFYMIQAIKTTSAHLTSGIQNQVGGSVLASNFMYQSSLYKRQQNLLTIFSYLAEDTILDDIEFPAYLFIAMFAEEVCTVGKDIEAAILAVTSRYVVVRLETI